MVGYGWSGSGPDLVGLSPGLVGSGSWFRVWSGLVGSGAGLVGYGFVVGRVRSGFWSGEWFSWFK